MIPSGGEAAEPFLNTPVALIAIVILVGLSGFFAGSETALTGASRARMHTLEKEGSKRAALVNKIRERKDNMIGALMLGNTAVHVMASAIAAGLLIELFGEAGVLYASAAMTAVMIVFGEVLPKTYALHRADSMAMTIAPLIKAVIAIFAPLTAMITFIVRFILRLCGMDMSMVSSGHHLELLRGAIDLHRGPEEEVQAQRAMLRSVLDLADVEVFEIMTHRKNVAMVDASLPMNRIVEEVLDSAYTRLPLWKDDPDNIVGVIHVKALLKDMKTHEGRISKPDIRSLSTEPWFIPESTTLFDQLQAFRQRREHFALVVDEYGSFKGVVTLEDIIEEIVGEIEDELDEVVAGVRKQPNGSYMVDGDVTIRDLNREFEWNLPDENYATIAGLVLHEAQVLPEPGQAFHFYGFRFDIVRRQRNQITLVRISPPPRKQASEAA